MYIKLEESKSINEGCLRLKMVLLIDFEIRNFYCEELIKVTFS